MKGDLKSLSHETNMVSIQVLDGFYFHVADYYDGTRVVTCLDGGLRGYQGIAFNGKQIAECNNVKWFKKHFEHQYPNGKIYSYPNKQVIKLN